MTLLQFTMRGEGSFAIMIQCVRIEERGHACDTEQDRTFLKASSIQENE